MRLNTRISNRIKISVMSLSILFFIPFSILPDAMAEYRTALIIGNGDYDSGPLSDPPNDAQLMLNVLKRLGFEVFRLLNLNQQQMRKQIRNFGNRLKARKDSVGVFYYSGHGMQVRGRNYLIPIGETIESEDDVEIYGVNINTVLIRMESADNLINIVFLDACRNNPFEKSFKSATKGLGRISAPKGTIIAFAAEPNKVARQGPGNYSYFTESLAQKIVKPGISAIDMLREVRVTVYNNTGGKQVPVVEEKSFDKFYFNTGQKPSEGDNGRSRSSEIDRDLHFVSYTNGVVKDTKTGLEWIAGPDKNTSWYDAQAWVGRLTIAGGGWRMPTLRELKTLYQKGHGMRNRTTLFETKAWYAWSGESKSESTAELLYFFSAWSGSTPRSTSDSCRAFAVRSPGNGMKKTNIDRPQHNEAEKAFRRALRDLNLD